MTLNLKQKKPDAKDKYYMILLPRSTWSSQICIDRKYDGGCQGYWPFQSGPNTGPPTCCHSSQKNATEFSFERSLHACSVESSSLQTHELNPASLLFPWNFPGKISGVGCHVLLQGIFLTQGSNPCLLHLLHWQVDYVPLRHLGKLYFFHQRMEKCKLRLWSPGSPDRPRAGLLYRVRGEWAEFYRAALLPASDRSAGCSISAHGTLPPSWIECRVQHFCTWPTELRACRSHFALGTPVWRANARSLHAAPLRAIGTRLSTEEKGKKG